MLAFIAMLPLAVVDVPIAFPRIRCYQLWHPQPDRPSDIGWLRTLMSEVSGELVARKPPLRRRMA